MRERREKGKQEEWEGRQGGKMTGKVVFLGKSLVYVSCPHSFITSVIQWEVCEQ